MAEKRDKMKYKIALAQINSDADIAGNMKKIEKMIQEAADGGAELIAFPENSEYIGTDYPGNAQTVQVHHIIPAFYGIKKGKRSDDIASFICLTSASMTVPVIKNRMKQVQEMRSSSAGQSLAALDLQSAMT